MPVFMTKNKKEKIIELQFKMMYNDDERKSCHIFKNGTSIYLFGDDF